MQTDTWDISTELICYLPMNVTIWNILMINLRYMYQKGFQRNFISGGSLFLTARIKTLMSPVYAIMLIISCFFFIHPAFGFCQQNVRSKVPVFLPDGSPTAITTSFCSISAFILSTLCCSSASSIPAHNARSSSPPIRNNP